MSATDDNLLATVAQLRQFLFNRYMRSIAQLREDLVARGVAVDVIEAAVDTATEMGPMAVEDSLDACLYACRDAYNALHRTKE